MTKFYKEQVIGAAAKSKLKKATLLNLRNKATIIITAAISFLKHAHPAVSGATKDSS